MNLLLVGLGGALGSLVRYVLGKVIAERWVRNFPLHTFLINVTGAFLLGVVSSVNPGNNGYLFLADGFLGAYTTFSTFVFEGFSLYGKNRSLTAGAYILTSLLVGILFYYSGSRLGTWLYRSW